jgi:hypothetical protein
MRFIEFADPKGITTIAVEAEELLKQLLRLWSSRSPDDLVPSVPHNWKQPPINRGKLFDAL